MEKSNSIITYLVGLLMMWFSRHTVQDIAFMVGAFVAVVTLVINVANFFINWHYRRKTFELQRRNVQGVTLESDG
ncbi:hypothetical protein VRB95_18615 [Erwinia aphidicola]|uniref:hypothetical protein n=1 Tax=Erwinia TaxID=551 RepID=UPI00105E4E6D|nr:MULTISPECIES: hypothetical protein [Erwinia]MCP2231841.1 positive regulator of sigma E activity [Erwinia aphidicola]MCQ4106503.1 phage holin family protein [Erwinia persicina]UTX14750.1 phage holin family protein [Erwinia persicina]